MVGLKLQKKLYVWPWTLKKTICLLELPLISRIKISFKRHGVYHILRHPYYTTMQKLCEFEALYRPEIQCKCHKGSP